MSKNNDSHFKKRSINFRGKERTLYYVGEDKELDNLIQEIFEFNVYDSVIDKEKKSIILDVGAYIGDSALYFYDYAEKIYCLEPNEDVYQALEKNIKENKMDDKVIPFNLALAGNMENRRLYSTAKNNVASTLIPFNPGVKGKSIKAITINKFMEDNKIEHIDLMKLDVEGAEYEILESESFTKVADKIDRLVIEVHPFQVIGAMGGTVWKIENILTNLGYRVNQAPGSESWKVMLNYSDGRKEWTPMLILQAIR